MRKITFLFCLAAATIHGQTATYFQWGKTLEDTVQISAITTAGSDVLYTGGFHGSVDFDPGPGNVTLTEWEAAYVSKLNSNGTFAWVRAFSIPTGSNVVFMFGSDIVTGNNGDIYSTGTYKGLPDLDPGAGTYTFASTVNNDCNIYISKLSSAGNFIWARDLRVNRPYGSSQLVSTMVIDNQDNLYVAGSFSGTVDFDPGAGVTNVSSAGMEDIFVLKLDASGNFVWVKTAGGTGSDVASDITFDGLSNVTLTGHFTGTVDLDPGAGTANHTSLSGSDVFVLRLNTAGNYVWSKNFEGSSAEKSKGITDGMLIHGSFQGTLDADPGPAVQTINSANGGNFLIRLDASGNYLWARVFQGALSCVTEWSGTIYAAGYFSGTIDADPGAAVVTMTATPSTSWSRDTYVILLSSTGTYQSGGQIAGAHPSAITHDNAIALSNGMNIYLGGGYKGSCDLDTSNGTYTVTSGPSYLGDSWLQKINLYPVGIREQSEAPLFSIQPNPTRDFLNIHFTTPGLKTVDLVNAIGQSIYRTSTDQETESIDVATLPQGIYFVKITDHNGAQQTKKIVKAR